MLDAPEIKYGFAYSLVFRHDEMDLAMLEDGNLGMINSRITQLQKDIDKTRTMKEALVSNLTQLQKREEKTKRKVCFTLLSYFCLHLTISSFDIVYFLGR